jgi:hypothetical protein
MAHLRRWTGGRAQSGWGWEGHFVFGRLTCGPNWLSLLSPALFQATVPTTSKTFPPKGAIIGRSWLAHRPVGQNAKCPKPNMLRAKVPFHPIMSFPLTSPFADGQIRFSNSVILLLKLTRGECTLLFSPSRQLNKKGKSFLSFKQ